MKLNEEQERVANELSSWLSNTESKDRFFVIKGSAGTGKTTLIGSVLSDREDVMCMTPTHAAKNVMSSNASYPCYTIHKALNIMGTYDSDDEYNVDTKFESKGGDIITDEYNVIVIDEASMINDSMVRLIEKYTLPYHKIIVLGDPLQLAPVRQRHETLFFNELMYPNTHTITKQMRFKEGTDIYNVTNGLREAISNGGSPYLLDRANEYNGILFYGEKNKKEYMDRIVEDAITAFDGISNNRQMIFHSRVLAYENVMVRKIGTYIRNKVMQSNGYEAEKHELLPYDLLLIRNNSGKLNNGDAVQVIDTKKETMTMKAFTLNINIPYYRTNINKLDTYEKIEVNLLDSNGSRVYEKYREAIVKYIVDATKKDGTTRKKMFKEVYYPFINLFNTYEYIYATTVHRSQGLTLNNVYINEDNIVNSRLKNSKLDMYKALYVAYTRARNTVNIYNPI